jgi:hypothetical protein
MKILLLITIVILTIFSPYIVLASTITSDINFINPLKAKSLFCFVYDILDVVLTIGLILAAMAIIYSGFLFVQGGSGDESKIKSAKTAFYGAVIGTAVLLGAWVIVRAIVGTINELRPDDQQIVIKEC